MKALVLSARSGQFKCEVEGGEVVDAVARKKTMMGANRSNPIIAGDEVILSCQGGSFAIEELLPRKTLVTRGSEKRRGGIHAIVANVDHGLVVFAADKPRSRVSGIDRYIIACEYQHLAVTLVFNKWDLRDEESEALAEIYRSAGYPVLTTCATNEPASAREALGEVDFEKLYVLGPSGVGKSSILNATIPDHGAVTGAVNQVTGKGRQTTTHIELIPCGQGRYIADTPGLGHLSMLGIEPHNLRNFYREYRALQPQCRYPDCLHLCEPDCAVLEEVGHKVHPDRHQSYREFYEDLVGEAEKTKLRGKSRGRG